VEVKNLEALLEEEIAQIANENDSYPHFILR
jgi:hypothetical protein